MANLVFRGAADPWNNTSHEYEEKQDSDQGSERMCVREFQHSCSLSALRTFGAHSSSFTELPNASRHSCAKRM